MGVGRVRGRAAAVAWVAAVAVVWAAVAGAEGRVLLVGHRGAPSWRPEETLPGYELAAALAADFLEADLCATKDHRLVCRHECELSATTDVAAREEFADRYRGRGVGEGRRGSSSASGGWYTEDFSLAELQTLRARERLPEEVRSHAFDGLAQLVALEEFLQLAAALAAPPSQPPTVAAARQATSAPLGVYIETKTPTYFRNIGLQVEELLLEALEAQGLQARCSAAYDAHYPADVDAWVEACGVILQSFEDNLKTRVWQSHPYYPVIQLLGEEEEQMRGSEVLYGDLMTEAGLEELATWATGVGPAKTSLLRYNRTTAATTAGDSAEESDEGEGDPCAGVSFQYASTGLLERAHAANLLVHPYTFRKEEYYLDCAFGNDMELELEAFFALGVDGVFTDSMEVAAAARARMFPEAGSYVASLVLGLYVVTALTCAAYGAFMAAALVAWVAAKVRARRAPLVIAP